MLSFGEDVGAVAGPSLREVQCEKQPWRWMPKDIPREDVKESICQNLENNKLLVSLFLSVFA